jgi:5-methylcytosine-specific restriction endonuclease McrA
MTDVLDTPVLVLNKYFQPIHIIGARDAIRLVYCDKADVVHGDYDVFTLSEWELYSEDKHDGLIRTPTRKFVAPEVIRLLDYDSHIKYSVSFTRDNLFSRDNFQCQYCGTSLTRKEITIDHVIPVSRQNDFQLTKSQIQSWDNLVAACKPCNNKKGNKTPTEARMSLLSEPSPPRWFSDMRGVSLNSIKPSWRTYLESLKGSKSV